MLLFLKTFVTDFADGIRLADGRRPQAGNSRSKTLFKPGIGPHSEAQTVALVMRELSARWPERYQRYKLNVPYPNNPRQKCDLCIGNDPGWDWAVEVKMLRLLGDNGKLNDNILMHILSPYPAHRSALTDCTKLGVSGLGGSKAVLIYGYDHPEWPLEPAIEAFEALARSKCRLGGRESQPFAGLVHPVHSSGTVFGWQIPSK
jgi:hypothetical protein